MYYSKWYQNVKDKTKGTMLQVDNRLLFLKENSNKIIQSKKMQTAVANVPAKPSMSLQSTQREVENDKLKNHLVWERSRVAMR